MQSGSEGSFGRYRLVRRLACGGMAEVFLASSRRPCGFEKQVVLKRILPQHGADPDFVRMFIDEATLAARMTHSNIVQVHDFGVDNGVHFITMEHVDGVDIRHLVDGLSAMGRRVTPAEVAAVGEGVARGLSYAHALADDHGRSLAIVHRDVSPHNVMVSCCGVPKVMDFGIAKATRRSSRTATGTIKGKVAYMAPEQAAGKSVDKRCDQFSLGLVLWEMLVGQRHFDAPADDVLLRDVIECQVRPPSSLRRGVPAWLESIILRTLARDPEARYGDLADVAAELQEFRLSLGREGRVDLATLVDFAKRSKPDEQVRQRRTLTLPAPDLEVPAPVPLHGNSDELVLPAVCESLPSPLPARRSSVLLNGTVAAIVAGVIVAAMLRAYADDIRATRQNELPRDDAGLALLTQYESHQPWSRAPARPDQQTVLSTEEHSLQAIAGSHRSSVPQRAPQGLHSRRGPHGAEEPSATPPKAAVAAVAVADESARGTNQRRAPAVVSPGFGTLSLRTAGVWAEVYHNGRKLGTTPLTKVEVPAGSIRLYLVNRAAGLSTYQTVVVRKGEETRRTFSLRR